MKPGLLSFIFISATAHLAVLNYGSQWSLELNENNEQGSSSFAVEIIYTKAAQEEPAKPQLNAHAKEIISVDKELHNTSNKTQVNKLEQPVKIAENSASKDEKPDTEKAESQINLLSEAAINKTLKEELKKYFYYPKAAIRRDWQGKLVVSFTVQQDGSIDNIFVSKSSGYKILDDAAIKSVSKIKLPADDAPFILGDASNRSLPISYRLN